MTHGHHQGHGHGHAHGHLGGASGDERRVLFALVITGGFMVVEVAGGFLANSLALIADAGHMLTDTAALTLAWLAFRASRRPADLERSYGYHRFQVISALVNGATLIAISGWITVEAIGRVMAPEEVLGGLMLGVAVTGLAVNLVAFLLLRGGDHQNLNIRGASLHVLGDLLGSLAAIVAAGVILATGWMPIDPLLSVLVALLILRSAWLLVRQSTHILMEGTPAGLDTEAMCAAICAAVPEVSGVHHLHAWSLTPDRPLVTLHAHIAEGANHDRALRAIKAVLTERYGIAHATIQLEAGACVDEAAP
jgi:cobalt-zinc-cadmium efflux system protein